MADCQDNFDISATEETQRQLVLVDRSGSGRVYMLTLDGAGLLTSHKVRRERWKPLEGLVDFAVVVYENKLYVIGGKREEGRRWDFCDTVSRYDPVEDEWEERASLMLGRANCTATATTNTIVIAGGERPGGVATGSCEVYDPETDQWQKAGMLPEPRKCHAALADGDTVYVSGGESSKRAHDNIWLYEDNRWQDTDEHYPNALLRPLEKHCMVMCDHIIYFLGGIQRDDEEEVSAQLVSFCPRVPFSLQDVGDAQDQQPDRISPWTWRLPALTHARAGAAACLLGREIYVFGGAGLQPATSVPYVEGYDVDAQTWRNVMQLPKGDYSNVACFQLDFPKVRKSKIPELLCKPTDKSQPSSQPARWVLW